MQPGGIFQVDFALVRQMPIWYNGSIFHGKSMNRNAKVRKMGEAWRVTAWGVRGTAPTPLANFLEYGGNTSCFSAAREGTLAVFDCGSGLAGLGARMMEPGGPDRADLFLSHLHFDHVQGLLAFRPLFCPEKELHFYGRPGFAGHLNRLLSPPLWPVGLADFPAAVKFHEIRPGMSVPLPGGGTVTAEKGRHPNGCLAYRLDSGGKSLVYALDCEPDGATTRRLAAFAREASLLIWDASFNEAGLRPGWGHSTWRQGLAIAQAAQVKRVLMAHYCVDYDDVFLRGEEALSRAASPAVSFAKEGMVIEL